VHQTRDWDGAFAEAMQFSRRDPPGERLLTRVVVWFPPDGRPQEALLVNLPSHYPSLYRVANGGWFCGGRRRGGEIFLEPIDPIRANAIIAYAERSKQFGNLVFVRKKFWREFYPEQDRDHSGTDIMGDQVIRELLRFPRVSGKSD
jgi:hypothetical protein